MLVIAPLVTAAVLMVLAVRIAQMESKAEHFHTLRRARKGFSAY